MNIIDGVLQQKKITIRRKNFQNKTTRSDLAVLSIHSSLCLVALKSLLVALLAQMEDAMQKKGKHILYKKVPLPDFDLRWRHLQESSDKKDKTIEMKQPWRHVKNVLHIMCGGRYDPP